MSYELIAILIFTSMMLMLLTGQRVFGAIGGVATLFALMLWGKGASQMPYNSAFALLNWYVLLTLPLFVYMGYMFSESGIASDLYKMFHVWMGPVNGGLALGTMGLMVAVSAMNGLSVAGMAIGASLALPEMLKRNYDKVMVTGVIQAGSSLGHHGSAQRGARSLRHDRQATGWPTMAGRCFSRFPVSGLVYYIYLYQMQTSAPPWPNLIQGRAGENNLGREIEIAQGRDRSSAHYFFHDRAFPDGNHQSRAMFGSRCGRNDPCRSRQWPVKPAGTGGDIKEYAECQLHVHVGDSGGTLLWCCF